MVRSNLNLVGVETVIQNGFRQLQPRFKNEFEISDNIGNMIITEHVYETSKDENKTTTKHVMLIVEARYIPHSGQF